LELELQRQKKRHEFASEGSKVEIENLKNALAQRDLIMKHLHFKN
jgi:hypothetical protein